MKRLLDYDDLTGVSTYFHSDGETITLEDVQDVEPIIERNKLLQRCFDERDGYPGDGFHHVAALPAVVLLDLMRKGIMDFNQNVLDEKKLLTFLDDNENQYLRTRPGKLSR